VAITVLGEVRGFESPSFESEAVRISYKASKVVMDVKQGEEDDIEVAFRRKGLAGALTPNHNGADTS
jgi:hypothetical protein